uniref:Preprotein translocase subunit n=1 Tax=Tetraselmis sp. GSL018 TaxID=582737 RepID=A0A061RAU0_9CHLO
MGEKLSTASGSRSSQGDLVENILCNGLKLTESPLVDIGVNLSDKAFDRDRSAVLGRAFRAGVEKMILTGCCVRSSTLSSSLALQGSDGLSTPEMFFTAGVHPHNAKDFGCGTAAQLRRIASEERCVAIGECGLDFNRNFSEPDAQRRCFSAQVELACEMGLPLFVHCREAYGELTAILRSMRPDVPVVVHCFTGAAEDLEPLLEMGNVSIGVTGWVCDDRPHRGADSLAVRIRAAAARGPVTAEKCPLPPIVSAQRRSDSLPRTTGPECRSAPRKLPPTPPPPSLWVLLMPSQTAPVFSSPPLILPSASHGDAAP